MERIYEEAFAEIDEIFKIMPIDLLSKIPPQFRQLVTENKAKDYKVKIKEPLNEKNFKKETIVILGLIYRDFLVTSEEKETLQLRDAEELKRIEQKMQEQYDINNIFEKRKNAKKQENEEISTDLAIYEKPNFLKKIFNIIKGIFKKNKF